MSLNLAELKLQKELFLVTDAETTYIPAGPISANDLSALSLWVDTQDCSAGINVGNPGVYSLEYSPNGGINWYAIAGTTGGNIEGNGPNWNLQVTGNTPVFPPHVRIAFTAPAGESYRVKKIRRIYTLPGEVFAPKSAGSGAPLATEATLLALKGVADNILLDTSALVAKDFATETTLASVLLDTTALVAKDFATETTLASILLDTTAIAAKDFATETTLASVLLDTTALAAKDFATQTTLASVLLDTTAIAAKDFATQTTLASVLLDTTAIAAKDFSTETTLSAVKTVLDNIKLDTAPLSSVQAPAYKDYSTDNLDNVNWETLVVLTADVKELEIFDSSGELVDVSTDAGVSIRFTITPGGNERVPEVMATGTTISVRSRSAALINNGVLLMNLRG